MVPNQKCLRVGAQERTRTSTPLRELAPEASASANSATWAFPAAGTTTHIAAHSRVCQRTTIRATQLTCPYLLRRGAIVYNRSAAHVGPPSSNRMARTLETVRAQTALAAAALYGCPIHALAGTRRIFEGREQNAAPPDAAAIHKFASQISGNVITSETPDYESARLIFNRAFDERPALIVRCASAPDVARSRRPVRTTSLHAQFHYYVAQVPPDRFSSDDLSL